MIDLRYPGNCEDGNKVCSGHGRRSRVSKGERRTKVTRVFYSRYSGSRVPQILIFWMTFAIQSERVMQVMLHAVPQRPSFQRAEDTE